MNGNINYDYDEVIAYITGTAAANVKELTKSIDRLQEEIEDCEDKFHCKGTEGANIVLKIYQGFSDIMGESKGTESGSGLAGLSAYAGKIENTMYAEAKVDKETVESASNYDIF